MIASRSVSGASPEGRSRLLRHLVTEAPRQAAHLAEPRSRRIRDPLSGFFALRPDVLATGPDRSDGFKVHAGPSRMEHGRGASLGPGADRSSDLKAEMRQGICVVGQLWRLHRSDGPDSTGTFPC